MWDLSVWSRRFLWNFRRVARLSIMGTLLQCGEYWHPKRNQWWMCGADHETHFCKPVYHNGNSNSQLTILVRVYNKKIIETNICLSGELLCLLVELWPNYLIGFIKAHIINHEHCVINSTEKIRFLLWKYWIFSLHNFPWNLTKIWALSIFIFIKFINRKNKNAPGWRITQTVNYDGHKSQYTLISILLSESN